MNLMEKNAKKSVVYLRSDWIFSLKVMFSYRYELNLGASSMLKEDKLSMSMSIFYETDIGI